jgi:uncharacterized membrane protein YkoI
MVIMMKTMNRKVVVLVLLVGLFVGAVLAGGFAFNGAPVLAQSGDGSGDDGAGEVETNDADDGNEGPDVPITGTALEQASAAALEYIGEGRVTGTEIGDEEGYYEVEITKDNGRQVDVHLDEAFNILSQESD